MSSLAYSHELRNDPSMLAASLKDASHTPFWLDDPGRPEARPQLTENLTADLVVVGGGYAGLWTALIAKERNPELNVVLLEAKRVGWAASGRNGGFCEASLTHGDENGELHFKSELDTIARLAADNFAEIQRAIERYNIDAEWEIGGIQNVATEPHQTAWVDEALARSHDPAAKIVTNDDDHGYGKSPVYRRGIYEEDGFGYVHPAKLAWGLAEAAESLGVKIYEHTPVTKLTESGGLVHARTRGGTVSARRAALATNGFPSLLKRLRLFTIPIYDYALMTEPLTDEQLESIGWTERNGIADMSREFHYYRKTSDNRILFGGFDAVYHKGGKIRAEYDQRPETFTRLADHFFTTYPQLKGIRFTHQWGGMIDMSSQLVAYHGATRKGNIAYSAGYTGLGVGATRFGAEVMNDLLEGRDTERTRLKMSRRLPIPIPPEPFANPLVQLMRGQVQRSDRRQGKNGLILSIASFFKVGFDS